jgi:hypothetical protein
VPNKPRVPLQDPLLLTCIRDKRRLARAHTEIDRILGEGAEHAAEIFCNIWDRNQVEGSGRRQQMNIEGGACANKQRPVDGSGSCKWLFSRAACNRTAPPVLLSACSIADDHAAAAIIHATTAPRSSNTMPAAAIIIAIPVIIIIIATTKPTIPSTNCLSS